MAQACTVHRTWPCRHLAGRLGVATRPLPGCTPAVLKREPQTEAVSGAGAGTASLPSQLPACRVSVPTPPGDLEAQRAENGSRGSEREQGCLGAPRLSELQVGPDHCGPGFIGTGLRYTTAPTCPCPGQGQPSVPGEPRDPPDPPSGGRRRQSVQVQPERLC